MSDSSPVYRWMVRLYPREFRGKYGEDLVQNFADLVRDRGPRAAWARTSLDLIVTLPRYRLETIMSEHNSATAVTTAIVLLAAAGVFSALGGFYPGLALLIAALGLAVVQRNTLARAIGTPDSSRRRRRLAIASVLALVFLAAMVSYLLAIGDGTISSASLLIHNIIGVPAVLGSVAFLLIGILTRKDNRTSPSHG